MLLDLEQRLSTGSNEPPSLSQIHELFETGCEASETGELRRELLLAEMEEAEADKGLELRAGYTTGDLESNPDDGSANLELSWDLLRNGYLDNKSTSRNLRREAEIKALEGQLSHLKENYHCRRSQIANRFIEPLRQLLRMKLELMEPVYRMERRAYFKGWSYLDDYLVSEDDLVTLRTLLKNIHLDDFYDTAGYHDSLPPIVEIDLPGLISLIREDNRSQRIEKYRQEILEEKTNGRHQSHLRVFLRKGFDLGTPTPEDDDLVAGIRYRLPLQTRSKRADEIRARLIEHEAKSDVWKRVARTREQYVGFVEQFERVLKQEYRYRRAKERLRRSLVNERLEENAHLVIAVTRMRTFFSAAIERVQVLEELYRRINELFLAAGVEYQSQLLTQVTLGAGMQRARVGERAIYIWSDSFNHFDDQQLMDFLLAKQLTRVFLSAGRGVEADKRKVFLAQAREHGISVELLFGENSWAMEEMHDRALVRIASSAPLVDTLHLDIEPHALDGYRGNETAYLTAYFDLLMKLRTHLPDQVITISAPLHWPEWAYRKAAQLTDGIYLMAYENTNPEVQSRRIQKVLDLIPAELVGVALRAKDFPDEWEMEQHFDFLAETLGIGRFAVHQFADYFNLAGKRP